MLELISITRKAWKLWITFHLVIIMIDCVRSLLYKINLSIDSLFTSARHTWSFHISFISFHHSFTSFIFISSSYHASPAHLSNHNSQFSHISILYAKEGKF